MRISNKNFLQKAFFIETCVSPGLRFDDHSCSILTWRLCRILDFLLCFYLLWWSCRRILNATETPPLNRKKIIKTPKTNVCKLMNHLLRVPERSLSSFFSFSKSDVWGPALNTFNKHKMRLRWHRKVTGGIRRVPNGTGKAFDNLRKISCKWESKKTFVSNNRKNASF